MTTRTQRNNKSPASKAGLSYAGPSVASFANGPLIVPGSCDAWTWCVSPVALQCHTGRIVPRLAKAWHTPGLGGNGRDLGRGEGFVASLRDRYGYQPVPHDIECVAFGESRTEPAPSTYLDRYEGVTVNDLPCVYHTDAWHRPRVLGNLTIWDWDAAGWLDFLGRCLRIVTPGDLDPVQIELAMAPLIRSIRRLLDRKDERAAGALEQHLAHLPAEHAPADLQKRIDRFRRLRNDPPHEEAAAR